MDTDDMKRQGVAAKIELAQTEASFEAIRSGIIERMLSCKTDKEASALVWRLQAIDAVRGDLVAKAAQIDIADNEEAMRDYQ